MLELAPIQRVLLSLAVLGIARSVCVVLHELSHAVFALAMGTSVNQIKICISLTSNSKSVAITTVHGLSRSASGIVRHAGWTFSVAIACVVTYVCTLVTSECMSPLALAVWWTALDAVASDLLQLCGTSTSRFHCGNFGVIVLRHLARARITGMLRQVDALCANPPACQYTYSPLCPRRRCFA